MEKLPQIIEGSSHPIEIVFQDYLKDHTIDGRIVLPAVEIMQACACWVWTVIPGIKPVRIRVADFKKFFVINEGSKNFKALINVESISDDRISVSLVSHPGVPVLEGRSFMPPWSSC
jgi:hypothetical protein